MDILRKIRTLPTGPVVAVLILGIVFGEHAQPIGVFAWIGLFVLAAGKLLTRTIPQKTSRWRWMSREELEEFIEINSPGDLRNPNNIFDYYDRR